MKTAGSHFIIDGSIHELDHFNPAWLKGKWMIYEVLRAHKGKALFLSDHILRMQSTAERSGTTALPAAEDITSMTEKLIAANNGVDGNILFCLIPIDGHMNFLATYIEHRYPVETEYKSGVYLRSLKAMRNNPNAKIFNPVLRKKTEFLKASKEVYEILLVDKTGHITEGSRSNIFLVRGDVIYTPPLVKVLPGITRQKVIDICHEMKIIVAEQDIPYRELLFYEAAFISGTSPKILPICHIDNFRFNVTNVLMRKIMDSFDRLIS